MTERKPPGMGFETWIDKQIREAMERGEFDNLPGHGKPIPGLDRPDDEWWWIGPKLAREGVSAEAALPTPLRLRKEIEQLPEKVRRLPTETEVRAVVGDLNKRIRDWLLVPTGPAVHVTTVDAEEVVERWRAERVVPEPPPEPEPEPRRRRWWRRRGPTS
jgi:hypothetical protein